MVAGRNRFPAINVSIARYEQLCDNAFRTITIGGVAQRSEQGTHNPLVQGSNPCASTHFDLDFVWVSGDRRFAGTFVFLGQDSPTD